MKRKYAVMAICAALCTASMVPAMADFTEINDAGTLLSVYMDGEHDNYNMEGDISMGITVSTEGVTVEIPVDIGLDLDVAGDNMHGDLAIQMDVAGESMDEDIEIYAEQGDDSTTTYMNEGDGWECSVSEDSYGLATDESLEDLDWVGFESTDDAYQLTTSFSDLKDAIGMDADGIMEDLTDLMGEDADSLFDNMSDGQIVYSFDKDTLDLMSITMDDLTGEATIDSDGSDVDIAFTLSMEFGFSDFGEVDEDDVKVPDDVKEEADAGDVNEDVDEYEEEVIDEDEDYDDQIQGEILTSFGSYNGHELTAGPNDWSIFADDGWEWDMAEDEDGAYSFATAANEKYAKTTLYVFDEDSENANMADIEENGFYGYEISTYGKYEDQDIPYSFQGIGFGSSEEEIKEVFGNPNYEYTSDYDSGYRAISFDAEDNSYSVEFTLQDDEVIGVSVNFYNF